MQLCDSLQQNILDTSDALISSSEEEVDSTELRSHASLTGNEKVNRCVLCTDSRLEGHGDFPLLSFNPFDLGCNVHLICMTVPLNPVAKSISPETTAFHYLINTQNISLLKQF